MGFSEDVDAFIDTVRKRATSIQRIAAKNIINQVMDNSPVETGKMIRNWEAGINSPASGVEKEPIASGEASVGSTTRRRANKSAVIRDMHTVLMSATPEDDIYMTNNAEHFEKIEFGSILAPYDPATGRWQASGKNPTRDIANQSNYNDVVAKAVKTVKNI